MQSSNTVTFAVAWALPSYQVWFSWTWPSNAAKTHSSLRSLHLLLAATVFFWEEFSEPMHNCMKDE